MKNFSNNQHAPMAYTTYDKNNQNINLVGQNRDQQKDNISVKSENIKARKYKMYNLKDYHNLKNQIQNTKLGGLGANIGGEQWEIAKRKKEISMQYANNLKQLN